MNKYVSLAYGFLTLALVGLSLSSSSAQTKQKPMRIHVDAIGESVVLVGRLGEPLGTKVSIRGRWFLPNPNVKDYSIRFAVAELNGVKLENPVEFNINQMVVSTSEHKSALPHRSSLRELAGKEWSMIAYETGRVGLYPDEYSDKNPVFPVVSRPYYERPFTSSLVAVLASE